MKYVCTRGAAPTLGFADVLLAGLASDGGLYVPETWPTLPAARRPARPALRRGRDRGHVAVRRGRHPAATCSRRWCTTPTRRSPLPEVCPVVELRPGLHLLELFWGPTLAFKDVALQLVGRLFDHVLTEREQRVTILGATSGDTGSAAMDACRGRSHIDCVILFPDGRMSEVQRRQMTTRDRAQLSLRRRRGHVRRLPGPGEGGVRRRGVPHRGQPVGGQLDQLGPGDGADRLLRHRAPRGQPPTARR